MVKAERDFLFYGRQMHMVGSCTWSYRASKLAEELLIFHFSVVAKGLNFRQRLFLFNPFTTVLAAGKINFFRYKM